MVMTMDKNGIYPKTNFRDSEGRILYNNFKFPMYFEEEPLSMACKIQTKHFSIPQSCLANSGAYAAVQMNQIVYADPWAHRKKSIVLSSLCNNCSLICYH